MKPIPINLAVEDLLSESVARRLLTDTGRNFCVGAVYNRGGFGYLRKTALGWNQASKSIPFFLLTDLDQAVCASALLDDWFARRPHKNMLARVAVREVEAWLLADQRGLSTFFRLRKADFPSLPDTLNDPKATLVKLAAKSPRGEIRRRVVPLPRSTAKQGRDYNACLGEFVARQWSPLVASESSPSLRRCLARLEAFVPSWEV